MDAATFHERMQAAFLPGQMIDYFVASVFVRQLDDLRRELVAHIATEPAIAAEFLKTCIVASYAKANEIDDSTGEFGDFVDDLFGDWIRARQAVSADPDATAAQLVAWVRDDDFGFGTIARDVAHTMLDDTGLAAFERQMSQRIVAAPTGLELARSIATLTAANDWPHLATIVDGASREDLAAISHYTTEPAALGLAATHPRQAAKLRVVLGLRIVDAGKSNFYMHALEHFLIARDLMLANGQQSEWDAIARHVRTRHHRKSSFMPSFERLVKGLPVIVIFQPAFIARARRRKTRRRL